MGSCLTSSIELNNCTFDNTEYFSLNGQILDCRVVDVYDGDTCTCVIPLFNQYYKFTVRLADIDTCELKTKSSDEKLRALAARNRLIEMISIKTSSPMITNQSTRAQVRKFLTDIVCIVKIQCGEFDKYGRLLVFLFPQSETNYTKYNSFNYKLIEEKLAYYYDGGTKKI